jgi:glycosyltransferase involved in cell wall biosynthesis
MTKLNLRPYVVGDNPAIGSVPVSVIVLTRDEERNIRRCLASVAWADQVIVVDSGSSDETIPIARSMEAEVVEQPWLGFSGQRDFSLRLPSLRHDWVYFVDADEWISPPLAQEIEDRLRSAECAGFVHRLRLVFQGTWIRHCGWYKGSWVVRLVDRRYTKFDGTWVGRACVDGPILRLRNDIVDEDLKGLTQWLHKHVDYAELEAERRSAPAPILHRLRGLYLRKPSDTRPFARIIMKDVIYPSLPLKPVALFLYMYVIRLGVLDGMAGIRFCFYHAWHEVNVGTLRIKAKLAGRVIQSRSYRTSERQR